MDGPGPSSVDLGPSLVELGPLMVDLGPLRVDAVPHLPATPDHSHKE